jgi:hypothetical protein
MKATFALESADVKKIMAAAEAEALANNCRDRRRRCWRFFDGFAAS